MPPPPPAVRAQYKPPGTCGAGAARGNRRSVKIIERSSDLWSSDRAGGKDLDDGDEPPAPKPAPLQRDGTCGRVLKSHPSCGLILTSHVHLEDKVKKWEKKTNADFDERNFEFKPKPKKQAEKRETEANPDAPQGWLDKLHKLRGVGTEGGHGASTTVASLAPMTLARERAVGCRGLPGPRSRPRSLTHHSRALSPLSHV